MARESSHGPSINLDFEIHPHIVAKSDSLPMNFLTFGKTFLICLMNFPIVVLVLHVWYTILQSPRKCDFSLKCTTTKQNSPFNNMHFLRFFESKSIIWSGSSGSLELLHWNIGGWSSSSGAPTDAPGALSGSRGLAASCTAVHCGTVHYNTFYEPAVLPHFSAPTMVSSPIIIINQSLSLLISSLYTEKRQGGNAQFPSFSEIKIVF